MRAPLVISVAMVIIGVAVPASAVSHSSSSPAAAARPIRYSSCAQLHKKFPHGVGLVGARDRNSNGKVVPKPVTNFTRNRAWYLASKGLDRDHDGIACEAH